MDSCIVEPNPNLDQPIRTGVVLVVEDNPVNQRISRGLLQRLGFQVDLANDGQEGVEKWSSGHYDAIIMDCQMPVLDGYSATIKIRELERTKAARRMPIIALTAHSMPEDRQKCFESGMDEFLTKPIAIAALEHAIDKLLSD